MNLADTFIKSNLQCIQAIHFVSMCSLGIEPTTFALLTQCSTTEPQEHWQFYYISEVMGYLLFYLLKSNSLQTFYKSFTKHISWKVVLV